MSTDQSPREDDRATILSLLQPHKRSLLFAFLCIVGESAADVAQPWPLKIVIDNVIGHKQSHGWLFKVIRHTVGLDAHHILLFACAAVGAIALLDALCSYGDKYLTTSVGQWVTHDLRRSLYAHVQRLSMSYHDHSKTGDLISRVTSDIDSVQTFIVQGLLGILVNILTLIFMIAVMFHMNWRFTLVALSVVPVLFAIVYTYTRRAKNSPGRSASTRARCFPWSRRCSGPCASSKHSRAKITRCPGWRASRWKQWRHRCEHAR